jgi:flavodoxin
MNIGNKRIRLNPIPKDRIIFEQLTDETLEYNTDPSNFEYSEDVWKYGDRIVYMGENQLDCYIAGYIGSDNKLIHTPLSGFKYGPSPCPGDESEDDEDEDDEQFGGKKSRNRKTSKERKSRKSKKMKPRKNKSTRKH